MKKTYLMVVLSMSLITAHNASAAVKIKNQDLNFPMTKQYPADSSRGYKVVLKNVAGDFEVDVPLKGDEVTKDMLPSKNYTEIKVVNKKSHETLFTCNKENTMTDATLHVDIYRDRCTARSQ